MTQAHAGPVEGSAMAQMGERWLAAYGRAWEGRDPDAAAALFSPDALYAWGPYDEIRGREAIGERWAQATADQRDVRFR